MERHFQPPYGAAKTGLDRCPRTDQARLGTRQKAPGQTYPFSAWNIQ